MQGLEKTPLRTLQLKYETVQVQQGGSICGVLAIAFAVELLSGGNPSRVSNAAHI